MSGAANSPGNVDHVVRPAASPLPTAVSLAPLPAREAVGRATGFDRAPRVTAPTPVWRAAGATGLVALVAAAALPLVAAALAIPM